jgi:hypothetical protein
MSKFVHFCIPLNFSLEYHNKCCNNEVDFVLTLFNKLELSKIMIY